MKKNILNLLRCPCCSSIKSPSYYAFDENVQNEIIDGVVWCEDCDNWYPIEDYLLEFLPPGLSYEDDRIKFWEKYEYELKRLGLNKPFLKNTKDLQLQDNQQSHFDWFAENDEQTYSNYEKTPFWLAADKITFDEWRKAIVPGKWLLDVGCAQGRSTFKWMDLDLNIVAFDISKKMIRQAIDKYQRGNYKADAVFFTADATRFPIINESFDYILLYGVLHHLPRPLDTCKEIARVLKPGGFYFGEENNNSAFRIIFDLLQRFKPAWYEEAGPEHLFSGKKIQSYFNDTDVRLDLKINIFIPPHIINLFAENTAYKLIVISDKIGQSVPFLRDNGGIIVITGMKND